MHTFFIFIFIYLSIIFRSICLKFGRSIEQSIIYHIVYCFVDGLYESVNTRSSTMYTIRAPVILSIGLLAAKIMSLCCKTKVKVKQRKKKLMAIQN